MAMRYVEAGTIVTGAVTLKSGDASTKKLSLSATFKRKKDGATVATDEVKELVGDIKFEGNKATFEWDTNDVLEKGEMALPLRLIVSGAEQIYAAVSLVLYRSTLEVTALDESGAAVQGAGCKLVVRLDDEFEKAFPKWREDYRRRADGSREWTIATDASGKAVFTGLPVGALNVEWEPPYALTQNAWKTEGEFTPTGGKRKAEIRKLPVVHYIWWGNPSAEEHLVSASDTPNRMAATTVTKSDSTGTVTWQVPQALVMYWRQADANTLAGRIHANVYQQPITKLSELMKENGFAIHSVLMGRGKLLDDIIDTLSKYKFFSAVKDLISLCVAFKHGGYYFDTTTVLKDATEADTVAGKLMTMPADIRFPATATGGNYDAPLHDRDAWATFWAGKYSKAETDGRNVVALFTPNLDVWSMYAPPRHTALAMMIDSYIDRCVAFGLDSYPNNKPLDLGFGEGWKREWNGQTFHKFVTETCQPAVKDDPGTAARNRIIGNLIISSVQEGLIRHLYLSQNKDVPRSKLADGQDALVRAVLWKTKTATEDLKNKYAPAPVQAYLEEYSLPKAHSGSWRKTASATT